MSTFTMAGTRLSAFAPGYRGRSHVSEASVSEVSRSTARNRASFVRLAHKQDRVAGRADITTQLGEWFTSLSGDDLVEAHELVAGVVEIDTYELYDEVHLEPQRDEVEHRDGLYAGTVWDGFEEHLAGLGYASSMFLEEANDEGLRVTNAPSGYTYGRS